MNRAPFLYFGVLATVVASFLGLVQIPELVLRDLEPVVGEDGVARPVRPEGDVAAGRAEYVSLGCIYCHSQQVRPPGYGADIERGWGSRRTVARDHLHDQPPLLGTMRTGPDLANIGVRQPSENWHLLHLYEPTLTSPGSLMPPHRFLFDLRAVELERPADALDFPPEYSLAADMAVVPTARARALVAYLKSLDASYPVPEAP